MNGVSFEWLCGGPPTDAEPCPVAAYEKLLTFCSDLTLPPPWDFLPSDPDCRGPIENPEAALAALRKEFSDEALTQARILDRSASAGPRLKPSLCDPAGAVLALRSAASLNPYDLLTSGGCLSRRGAPALAARHDGRYLLSPCQTGTLFATATIREAALLRALGCVAASIHGLDRLSMQGLRSLHESYGTFSPAMGRLALVGWQVLPVQRAVPRTLAAAASHLAGAQAHLSLDLSGISVWYPSQSFIENLQFRLRLRDVASVRELLREHELELRELHLFAGDPGTCRVKAEEPADFVEAHKQLLCELARDRNQRYHSESAGRAQRQYEALIQRDLVEPLQRWALAQPDPVIRDVGAVFATLARLVHQSSTALLNLQRRAVEQPDLHDAELARETLSQHLQVVSRYERLARILAAQAGKTGRR